MSSSITTKIIVLLVAVGLAIIVGVLMSNRANAPAPTDDMLAASSTTQNGTNTSPTETSAQKTGATVGTKAEGKATVSGTQTKAGSLDSDFATIDAQISAVGTDESNADKSMNDTPVQQSY